jgi:bifunctional DNA-binding transcriptional regulator/antitoxin component of YhaV-PrlF toxin-antitoxin module
LKNWTVNVEEDPETGDLILPLPTDLLEEAGWKEGDTLEWRDRGDGSWSLEKKSV